MSKIEHAETIRDDDAHIARALEDAHIPSLILALVHLTGDLDMLRSDIRPIMEFLNPDDGLTDEQRTRVRQAALQALVRLRDDPQAFHMPGDAEIREMMTFLIGEEISDDYIEFLKAELSMHGEDPYAQPDVHAVPEATRADFKVLVIGAGMSGLLSAVRLKESGIAFEEPNEAAAQRQDMRCDEAATKGRVERRHW